MLMYRADLLREQKVALPFWGVTVARPLCHHGRSILASGHSIWLLVGLARLMLNTEPVPDPHLGWTVFLVNPVTSALGLRCEGMLSRWHAGGGGGGGG